MYILLLTEIRPREWSWNLPDNKQKLYKTNPYKAAICDYNIPKIKIVNGSISQQSKNLNYFISFGFENSIYEI